MISGTSAESQRSSLKLRLVTQGAVADNNQDHLHVILSEYHFPCFSSILLKSSFSLDWDPQRIWTTVTFRMAGDGLLRHAWSCNGSSESKFGELVVNTLGVE